MAVARGVAGTPVMVAHAPACACLDPSTVRLLPMCGIVGYVGPNAERQAPGRRDGGPAPTRVPRLRLRRASRCSTATARRHPQAGRQAGNLTAALDAEPAARRPAPASATPAGPPTAARPTPTPTRTWRRRRQARPDPQRHHRELRRAQGRAPGRGRHVPLARPTPRSRPLLLGPRRTTQHRRPDRGDARGRQPPRRRLHAARRARGPARRRRRRPPQLARSSSASATARTSSAPTSPPSSSTPARRWSSARTRS